MRLLITLDRDEDGTHIAEAPAIPGCVSQGANEKDALANIKAAIKECLEVREELGMPLTLLTREIEVPA